MPGWRPGRWCSRTATTSAAPSTWPPASPPTPAPAGAGLRPGGGRVRRRRRRLRAHRPGAAQGRGRPGPPAPGQPGWRGPRRMSELLVPGPGGHPIPVNDEGQGPAVLLLHPGSADRSSWAGVAAALAGRFRVLRFDRWTYRDGHVDAGPSGAEAMAAEVGDVLAVAAAARRGPGNPGGVPRWVGRGPGNPGGVPRWIGRGPGNPEGVPRWIGRGPGNPEGVPR